MSKVPSRPFASVSGRVVVSRVSLIDEPPSHVVVVVADGRKLYKRSVNTAVVNLLFGNTDSENLIS
ncbi:formamidopyrimidine-DNA glycosidase [Microbacterium sp. HM58-2]|nr:formamidopyrimidine-DNA glycosidase [Microbacterium sp. HM58-2]